jgi:hypothetical protein
MQRLDTPYIRTMSCTPCHVGTPAAEVTHDMIAAGHPRLNFEYLTFLELLPRHWKKRHDDEDGQGAWYGGQLETLHAGMVLAVLRATGPPELADWHCFACHHSLAPPGVTNRPKYQSLENVGRASDPFGRASRALQEDPKFLDGNGTEQGRKLIAALRIPERYAAGELDHMSWDDAAQTYYALRAAKRPAIAADLDRLAEKLRLPRSPAVVNSPVGYDPKAVAKLLAEIAEKGAK